MSIFGLATSQQCPFLSTVLSVCPHFFFYPSNILQIFLSTGISNTLNFPFCDFLLESKSWSCTEWFTELMFLWLRSRTFVDLLISSAYHIWCRLLTMPATSPILPTTSLSHDASCEIFSPLGKQNPGTAPVDSFPAQSSSVAHLSQHSELQFWSCWLSNQTCYLLCVLHLPIAAGHHY